jgi:hypothetical protein
MPKPFEGAYRTGAAGRAAEMRNLLTRQARIYLGAGKRERSANIGAYSRPTKTLTCSQRCVPFLQVQNLQLFEAPS